MNKFKKMVNDETGGALVLVMMVLVVLSALGVSVAATTMQSNQNSHKIQDHNSAYYIAEAGANLAYEDIESQIMEAYKDEETPETFFAAIPDLANSTYDSFTMDTGNPIANVQVTFAGEDTDSKTFKILSTGKVGQSSRTVEKEFVVDWVEKSSGIGVPFFPEGASTILKNNISLTNGKITGDIYLSSEEEESFILSNSGSVSYDRVFTDYTGDLEDIYKSSSNNDISGKIKTTLPMNIEIPWESYESFVGSYKYPLLTNYQNLEHYYDHETDSNSVVINNSTINIEGSNKKIALINLDRNYSLKELEVQSNRKLKINTYGKRIDLVINDFDMPQGKIEILGGGTLNIFVLNSFKIGGGSKINEGGNTNQFNLFYAGPSELKISGSQTINGGLHIKQADLTLTGSGDVNGPILTNGVNVSISGNSLNSALIIAPKAKIDITGSGSIKGLVVADELSMSGSAAIEYKKYNFENFTFDSIPTDSNQVDTTDLIPSVGPALEP